MKSSFGSYDILRAIGSGEIEEALEECKDLNFDRIKKIVKDLTGEELTDEYVKKAVMASLKDDGNKKVNKQKQEILDIIKVKRELQEKEQQPTSQQNEIPPTA